MNKYDIIQNKIKDIESLQRITSQWHTTNKKFAFTNGCFDLLHKGHLTYLLKAADLANHLIVAVNTDASVKRLKGEKRPVQDEMTRAFLLANFTFIDYVVFFDEDTPLELIKKLNPDYLVKGGDYKIETIVGADFVQKNGGKVITIPLVEGISTSDTINRIQNL